MERGNVFIRNNNYNLYINIFLIFFTYSAHNTLNILTVHLESDNLTPSRPNKDLTQHATPVSVRCWLTLQGFTVCRWIFGSLSKCHLDTQLPTHKQSQHKYSGNLFTHRYWNRYPPVYIKDNCYSTGIWFHFLYRRHINYFDIIVPVNQMLRIGKFEKLCCTNSVSQVNCFRFTTRPDPTRPSYFIYCCFIERIFGIHSFVFHFRPECLLVIETDLWTFFVCEGGTSPWIFVWLYLQLLKTRSSPYFENSALATEMFAWSSNHASRIYSSLEHYSEKCPMFIAWWHLMTHRFSKEEKHYNHNPYQLSAISAGFRRNKDPC